MERFLGPLAFGASGALFGLWVLRADFRRMGFAAPRELAPRDAVRHFSRVETALCACVWSPWCLRHRTHYAGFDLGRHRLLSRRMKRQRAT